MAPTRWVCAARYKSCSCTREHHGHLVSIVLLLSGEKDSEKRQLLDQLQKLDKDYSGGLVAYIQNSKRLLAESRSGGCHLPLNFNIMLA